MGLDMYLHGKKFFPNNNRHDEDGFPVTEHTLELGYWRKHPNLHGYIVQNFADGNDDCHEISLSRNDLQQIIHAIRKRELPHTVGFFFGNSDESDEQVENDIAVFERAIAWLDSKKDIPEWCDVIYRASW